MTSFFQSNNLFSSKYYTVIENKFSIKFFGDEKIGKTRFYCVNEFFFYFTY